MVEQTKLPQFIRNILWDVNPTEFLTHLDEYREFLAKRIAEKGNTDCLKWYVEKFGEDTLKYYLANNLSLEYYTQEFWQG